jgi:hypothetical protein
MAVTATSISQNGRYEPFYLQVARDQISWHKTAYVSGYNGDVDTAVETIWPSGGVLTLPSAAAVLTVSSGSASDAAAGTGARTVFISGLNASYNEISETVILNGQTAVNTVNSYLRIQSAYVATAGSGLTAVGIIYIGTGSVTTGVPATIYSSIAIGDNATQVGSWTVPAGYTAYITSGGASTGDAAATTHVSVSLVVNGTSGVARVLATVVLSNSVASFDCILPIAVPEKTTIETRAIGSAVNNHVAAYFQIVYILNDATL